MSGAADGFIDIAPDVGAPKKAPCLISCIAIGKATRKVSMVFRLAELEPDLARLLTVGPRFAIAFNPHLKVIRIKADPMGRYETVNAPRGLGKGGCGRVVMLRFPLPPQGIIFCKDRIRAELDVNVEQKAILIDLPRPFWPPNLAASPLAPQNRPQIERTGSLGRADLTSGLMGDPPSGRARAG